MLRRLTNLLQYSSVALLLALGQPIGYIQAAAPSLRASQQALSWSQVPEVVQEYIISYMAPKEIIRFLRINKEFASRAQGPSIWNQLEGVLEPNFAQGVYTLTLNLRSNGATIQTVNLQTPQLLKWIGKAHTYFRHITLAKRDFWEGSVNDPAMQFVSGLELHLHRFDWDKKWNSIFENRTNLHYLYIGVKTLKANTYKALQSCTNLHTLKLSAANELGQLAVLLKNLENLTTLELGDVYLDEGASWEVLGNCKKLKHLTLTTCCGWDSLLPAIQQLTKLESLSLDCGPKICHRLPFDSSQLQWKVFTKLTTLHIEHWDCVDMNRFIDLQGSLCALSCIRCHALADIQGLAGFKHLETLILYSCEKLASVKGISHLTELRVLVLGDLDLGLLPEELVDRQALPGLRELYYNPRCLLYNAQDNQDQQALRDMRGGLVVKDCMDYVTTKHAPAPPIRFPLS